MQEVVVSSHSGHLTRLTDILVISLSYSCLISSSNVVLMEEQLNYYWSLVSFIRKVGFKVLKKKTYIMKCMSVKMKPKDGYWVTLLCPKNLI